MESLAQNHAQSLREIAAANEDLGHRLGSLSVTVLYDRDDDVFSLTLGDPQEAITESIRNRLFLRIDPDTLKIVGIEVPHASRRLMDDPALGDFLRRLLPVASSEAAPAMQLASDLRQLVEARG